MASPPVRTQVFISYSHKDESPWLGRIQTHLKALKDIVQPWDDTMIQTGTIWREKIKQAIDSARIAVLLISADFLASDFIEKNELPPLLEKAEKDGMLIIPVIISDSRFKRTESLSKFQTLKGNSSSQPLINMKKGEQEAIFNRLSQVIEDALKSQVKSQAQPVEPAETAQPAPVARVEPLTLRFVDDLTPNDDSVRAALNHLLKGETEFAVEWSPLNERLFKLAVDIRPELQQRFRKLGVAYGDEMNEELGSYDALMSTVRRFRENTSRRIVPLWKGMQQELSRDYFTVPALRHYMIHANLIILMKLHAILPRPAGISPIFHNIDTRMISSTPQLLRHPTIRPLLGVTEDEEFWNARFSTPEVLKFNHYGVDVWAPRGIIIDAYQSRWHREAVTNGFVHKFALPQVETDILAKGDLNTQVNYLETSFNIEKILNEQYREVNYSEIRPDPDDFD